MNDFIEALRLLRKSLVTPAVSTGLVLTGIVAAGFVAIALAWRGASLTPYVPFQVPFLVSGGFGGLALVVLGLGLFDVHVNRVQEAKRHVDTNAALREAVQLLAVAPTVRRRRARRR
ncbi:MAG TPA: hypothetical protein VNA12_03090 [Mycobacteriales bacterium]|nr:hypothetical protein [Mycobacteriales bacterium]